jgi:uncharacterized coiled-coil protein SlyX
MEMLKTMLANNQEQMDANQTKVDKILKKMLEAQPWEEKKR